MSIGRKIKKDCGSFLFEIGYGWESCLGEEMYVTLKREKKDYGSRTYFHHCNGKLLMDFHGSLLMFLFYLEYERNIRKIVHTRTI
jgi:hypothetical protein